MADAPPSGPEQLLGYIRTRAAGLDAGRLRARVRAAAGELEAALDGLGEADARRRMGPAEWTVAEVVDHVAQSTVRSAEELRHLAAGRRPPGPPVYEALVSGAAHRVPWAELVLGLREACAALDASLGEPPAPGPAITVTGPAILLAPAPGGSGAPVIFTAELTWAEHALVQRLHLLDHRGQIRTLRAALAARA
jgi:hypothetical protein